MKVGIIGTGKIGSNLARLLVAAGHEVILSWSRTPEKLIQLSVELGNHKKAKAASVMEASQDVDISILSVRFSIMNEVKKQMGDINNKIFIDTNNPYDVKLPPGVSAAAEVVNRFPGIRLVKAFNTLQYDLLLSKSFTTPLTIMPLSSNDDVAKQLVCTLIKSVGYEPFDLGSLANVLLQEPNGPFFNKALTLPVAEHMRNTYSSSK